MIEFLFLGNLHNKHLIHLVLDATNICDTGDKVGRPSPMWYFQCQIGFLLISPFSPLLR